ncbi:MAG: response regulator [Phycisphaeraceae bacterium]|nr:response regulator [Phycisphaeraceae bacterium]
MNSRIVRQRVAPRSTSAAPAGLRPNSVNLAGGDLEKLLTELDGKPGAQGDASKNRDFVRWNFRPQGVEMRIDQSGGTGISSSSTVKVACRNLSRGGMSIIHGSFIHVGSAVTIFLKNRESSMVPIAGSVVRCRHVKGMVHELGIKFNAPIDSREFVQRDPFSDCFSLERVDPAELTGCVVCVDDNPMDQKLVQHYLRGTQIRLRTATSKDEAMPLITEGCDLVLCDFNLGDHTVLDILKEVRSMGLQTPVIATTADTSALSREHLMEAQASALVAKPLTQSLLLRAIAEFLMVGNSQQSMRSTLDESDPNAALIDAFVQQARQFAERLEKCLESDDAGAARTICLQIRGTAPMLGFATLGKLADAAVNAVTASGNVKESAVQVRSLVAACQRIQAA